MDEPALTSGALGPCGHAEQVRTLFDSKASGWSGKYAADGRLAGRMTLLAGAVHDLAAAGGELLDLGCGSGDLARHLAAVGYRVTGCDIAPQMLRAAQDADLAHAVNWIQLASQWSVLPFAPDSMDAVVAASVLEYVADVPTVLRECARVLRPGGVLLCTVPAMAHPVRWLECPLRLAARTLAGRAVWRAWPRLGPYLTYLRISRQRRRARWWEAAAWHAGLRPAKLPVQRVAMAPLRLLAYVQPGEATAPRLARRGYS